MKRLIALLFLPLAAYAGFEVTRPLMTVTDCAGNPVDGVTQSTDEAYAIQKAVELGAGEWCIERPDIRVVVEGEEPDPVPDPNEPAVTLDPVLVYTRIPRTQTVPEDARDRLPETGHMHNNFTGEGQMVLRDGKAETVVYDCTGQPCLPFDYSASPDGTKIAFALYRADSLDDGRYLSKAGSESQIYIYDRVTQDITPWPHAPGEQQTNPEYLPDGRVMYSTDVDGFFEPWLYRKTPYRSPQPQLHIADADGSNSVPVSPHDVSGALHPQVLSTGRIAYSQFWLSHNLPHIYTNGANQGFTTLPNNWVLNEIDLRGGDPTAMLGAHKFQFQQAGGARNQKSLHFIGERLNHDICTANYYRGNNMGLGDVFCFTPEAKGVEGPAPDFTPSNLYTAAEWSVSNDNATKDDTKGKIGFPEGHPDGGLIFTLGRGLCSTVQLSNRHAQEPERIGCDAGLYHLPADKIPSDDISDAVAIVDSPLWHEFGARVVDSWQVDEPTLSNTTDGGCQLASSDALSTDAYPKKDYSFNHWMYESANNGSRLPLVDQSELSAIRLYEVVQNLSKKPGLKVAMGAVGHRLKLMGDIPLLADGSFRAEVPCDVPYVMAGVDANGLLIMRDQVPQSLRPGELRVCNGCHLHGQEGRPFADSLAATAEAFEVLTSTPTPTYNADIKPIIEAKFAQCGVPTDYEDLVWDSKQQALPEERRLVTNPGKSGTKPYWLERPQLSLFIDSMYARKSLLYWIAVGERTDGLTDATYPDDIDYAGWCDAGATDAEARLIADWIDAGSVEN